METLLDFLTKLYQSSKRYRERLDCPLSAFQQLDVCQACRSPGSSQDAIARRLCVSKSSAARHLAALEQSGYVTRATDPEDRRILRVTPTEKALAIFPQEEALMEEWEQRLLEDFTPEERTALAALLERAARKAAALTGGESGVKKKG